MNKFTTALVGLAALAMAAPASAQQDDVQINGYGQWAYGRTNENHYLGGSEHGDYEHFNFSLSAVGTPSDQLRISALAFWGEGDEGAEVHLEYAFAEYAISEALSFRAGRSRVPFGNYAELLEVGTVRPFFNLAQGIYGPSGIVTESYQGVGITGSYYGTSDWGLTYDVYVGHMDFHDEGGNAHHFLEEEPDPLAPEEEEHGEGEAVDNIVGAKFVVHAPVDGLSFGLSAYSGDVPNEDGTETRRTAYAAQTEYVAGSWEFRAEVARNTHEDESTVTAYYGEVAYRLTDHWQIGARYDWADVNLADNTIDVSEAPTLLNHKDIGFTLNYWLNNNFVIKGSLQLVDGNLFAGPDRAELDDVIDAGLLNDKTTLFLFGTQFSF